MIDKDINVVYNTEPPNVANVDVVYNTEPPNVANVDVVYNTEPPNVVNVDVVYNTEPPNVVNVDIQTEGSGPAIWGSIAGNIDNQEDLKQKFDTKASIDIVDELEQKLDDNLLSSAEIDEHGNLILVIGE